ncbi:uncharacterized protein MYCFIDRAFT_83814 [Pseudocercospora fijiensis CIRAD86]|uniref:Uncharacterized protein n=1 Tax=Pseudocercospora fijiensis (strain CIRAD86) TaxID=383855 RepID=M3A2X2_PSEFD|nr:uncharacterized protein MYCFIDRAFT_83814 [Pseudocercospora fijiensis CIRAD86]EME78836.1 hypothetical protein MYCFIDRAFT_83814 [Pseudocercospora fijiensis CIRAD86]
MLSFSGSSARTMEADVHEPSITEDISSWQVVEPQDKSIMGTELKSMPPRSHDSLISSAGDGSPISRWLGTGFPATSIRNANSTAMVHDHFPLETSRLVPSSSAPSGKPLEQSEGDSISDDYVMVDGEMITIHLRGQEVQVLKCVGLSCDGTCPPSCPFYRRDFRGRADRVYKKVSDAVEDIFARDDGPDRTNFKAFVTITGDLADDLGRTLKHKLFDD